MARKPFTGISRNCGRRCSRRVTVCSYGRRYSLSRWGAWSAGSWSSRVVRDPLLICGLSAFVILWYCNSAWCSWWFGDAFGGRAFLELSLVFVMGLTFGFTLLWDSGNRFWRRLLVGLVLLAVSYNYGLMWLYFKGYIPRADYLF